MNIVIELLESGAERESPSWNEDDWFCMHVAACSDLLDIAGGGVDLQREPRLLIEQFTSLLDDANDTPPCYRATLLTP